jgi:aerobic carbon-monoxide dehydrogenase large subunit
MTSAPGLEPYRQPVLAKGHVRYVGEPVAAAFAADPYTAEDVADLVTPEIEPVAPCLVRPRRRASSRRDAVPRPL